MRSIIFELSVTDADYDRLIKKSRDEWQEVGTEIIESLDAGGEAYIYSKRTKEEMRELGIDESTIEAEEKESTYDDILTEKREPRIINIKRIIIECPECHKDYAIELNQHYINILADMDIWSKRCPFCMCPNVIGYRLLLTQISSKPDAFFKVVLSQREI